MLRQQCPQGRTVGLVFCFVLFFEVDDFILFYFSFHLFLLVGG